MKKFKIIVPIMVIVIVLATIMLSQDQYDEVSIYHKIIMTVGAAILSSLLGLLLLRPDKDKIDPKPTNQSGTNKRGNGK